MDQVTDGPVLIRRRAELTGGLEMHPWQGRGMDADLEVAVLPRVGCSAIRPFRRPTGDRRRSGVPVLPAGDRVQTGALVVPVGAGP